MDSKPIAAAILVVGIMIAGAILLKGNTGNTATKELKLKQFNTCLDSGRYSAKVEDDVNDGVVAGVRGTPTSFVLFNGVVVDEINGAEPLPSVLQKIQTATTQQDLGVTIRPISSDDHILGNRNAEIIIVEYSDTECPFCKRFHNTMHQALKQNTGRVAWVYRHFPIPQLHEKATLEAEATECAWEQGGNDMFWKYIDQIFERTNSNDSLPIPELTQIAKDLGLK